MSIRLLLIFSLLAARWVTPPAFAAALPVQGESEIRPWSGDEASPAQEQAMWADIQRNLPVVRQAGARAAPEATPYGFPLRLAPGLPEEPGFRVSAFSDHNPASSQVQDYNGGTRTYDGHRGTDYALWPFGWNKLDAGAVQVVAAAAGTIISSANVDSTDHNCNIASNDPWNYVALLHADGRMTIYGHLRHNSVTSKTVGQAVAQGEVLGTVGSSGNSGGPHLHFEVRYGSFSNAEWIDPYAGPASQPGSLWASQRPYYDSAINKLTTQSGPPASPDPCLPSITNLKNSFSTPARVYFYAYFRDFQPALATQLKIYRPDGSIYNSWQYAPGGSAFSSAWNQGWVFDFTGSDPAGTWRFEAVYNTQTTETFFNLNLPPSVQVTSPAGGEQWDRHGTHSLTWSDNFGGEVNLALYRNGAYLSVIAYNTPGDGEYLWTPDLALAAGTGYTLRVTGVSSPEIFDESDTPFTLTEPPTVIARNDFALTLVNTPVTVDALGNDQGPPGALLTITVLGQPGHGAASLQGAGLVYTPAAGFLGCDAFNYTASANSGSASATVTVCVAARIFQLRLPLVRR